MPMINNVIFEPNSLRTTKNKNIETSQGTWHVFGFYKWKKKFIPSFLATYTDIQYHSNLQIMVEHLKPLDNVLIWSSKPSLSISVLCADKDISLWRMEDGFLRSVGLGSDLIRPLSLVIDSCGIYYDATAPSDLENLLNTYHFDVEILNRSKKVCMRLVELKISKYNVGKAELVTLPKNKKIILVPGQVETDASIQFGSPIIKTNIQLLEVVRKENPDSFIIYKPHPDVLAGGRIGELDVSGANLYDQLILNTSIIELFELIDELHTMSSLSGFEALLRNKKVVTYGMPFYAGWGLTADMLTCERRKRSLTLDQLVAATLILYPIYVDPESGDVCDVETAIHILHKQQNDYNGTTVKTLLYRLYRKLFEKKR